VSFEYNIAVSIAWWAISNIVRSAWSSAPGVHIYMTKRAMAYQGGSTWGTHPGA